MSELPHKHAPLFYALQPQPLGLALRVKGLPRRIYGFTYPYRLLMNKKQKNGPARKSPHGVTDSEVRPPAVQGPVY